jgi:predicted ester cyclase
MAGSAGAPIGLPGGTLEPDVERDASERGVVIRRNLVERWRGLDHRLRARVTAVLSASLEPRLVSIVDGKLPDAFAQDLATGGHLFRSAFPELTRVVAAITSCPDSIDVVVACAGVQSGPFYGLIAPTLRHVQFELGHRFALDVDQGWLLEHRIHIDIRRIVAQLGADGRCRHGSTGDSQDSTK